MDYQTSTGHRIEIPGYVIRAGIITAWTAWADANARCSQTFEEHDMDQEQPSVTAREWTHPRTGEKRYYLDSDGINAAAEIDYRTKTIAGEELTARDMTRARQVADDSRIWVDEAGELHHRLHPQAKGSYAAEAILERLRTARIVRAEAARPAKRGTGWSKYSRPSSDDGIGAMLGRRSPARGGECHFCGLDRRTCDCH